MSIKTNRNILMYLFFTNNNKLKYKTVFSFTLYQGQTKETWDIKIFAFTTFRRILEALCVELRNSESVPGLLVPDSCKYFNFSSGNRTHNRVYSRTLVPLCHKIDTFESILYISVRVSIHRNMYITKNRKQPARKQIFKF